MTGSIDKNTLVEMEFELNRKDIMHCRTLIADVPSSEELIVLAPPPVAHGYVFKAGDRVDLYCSLLNSGDYSHILHIKTTVTRIAKTERGTVIHMKRNGFERRIALSHFFILRSKASILLQRIESPDGSETIAATVHSVTLNGIHITTHAPLKKAGILKGALALNGTVIPIQGKVEPEDGGTLTHEHSATIHFTEMTPGSLLTLAKTIETIQKSSIESRIGSNYHGVLDRTDIQDAVILEHLVPRSRQRILLDGIEIVGWLILILIVFDTLMALPPGTNLFDRFFQVKRSLVWDQEQLRLVPFYLVTEATLCISAFILHQYIYFRGNTRRRFTLWALSFLAALTFLTVQGHL